MVDPRRRRELAFRALFQLDALGGSGPEEVASVRGSLGSSDEDDGAGEEVPARDVERALETAMAAYARRRAADAELNALSPKWPAHRRPAADRAILRLCWYELTCTDAPGPAVVNEGVELAKRYSTDRSPGFVNAVLDGVLKRVRGEAGASEPDEASAGTN